MLSLKFFYLRSQNFLLLLFCFSVESAVAQQNEEGFLNQAAVVSRAHYGFILAHHARVEHLVKHTYGFEISLSRQTTGNKSWEQIYWYPQTGFSYIFLNFNNPNVLGSAHGLLAFVNFPLRRGEHFQLSLRLASGPGYVTKKYERVENYKNDLIGSSLNAAIQVNVETRYRLSQHLYYNFNVGLTHFSNGSFRTPNLGINNPSVNSGFTWQLHPSKEFTMSMLEPGDRRWQFDLFYGTGVKENYPPTGNKYFAHTLSSSAIKPLGYKIRFVTGVDVFYDLGLIRQLEIDNNYSGDNSKIIRSGIHAGVQLLVNNLIILGQMGVYWLDQYKGDGMFYHRIGFQYTLTSRFFASLTLKTHFAKADFVECGAGWRFGKPYSINDRLKTAKRKL